MILSIILTVYNKKQYLTRALDVLLGQKETREGDYEIIAVNDGSTDGSINILEEYARINPCVRIINQSNQGLSMARNNGLDVSTGDYIWFVDADDTISTNSVNSICKAAQSHPDIIPIYAQFKGDEKIHNYISCDVKTGKDVLLDNWEHCGVFWIMRKEFLLENNLRFFPGIYHEDAEFTPRMLYYAETVRVIPCVLYTVDVDPNSITQIPRPKRAFDCLTVAEHICDFCEMNKEIGTPIGRVLYYNASVVINNGFNVIVNNSKEDQMSFNRELSKRKKLLDALWGAPLLKYRIESLLFKLFQGRYVSVYKTMKLIG